MKQSSNKFMRVINLGNHAKSTQKQNIKVGLPVRKQKNETTGCCRQIYQICNRGDRNQNQKNEEIIDISREKQCHSLSQKNTEKYYEKQIQILKQRNQALESSLRQYQMKEEQSQPMKEQLEFRREQQFQILQMLRQYEKFNHNIRNKLQTAKTIIQNYEKLCSKTEYEKVYGPYQEHPDSKASNDQLKTTGRAGEDTRHRNSLTVSIIEDSDGQLNKSNWKIAQTQNNIGFQKQNHPLTPKQKFSIKNLLENASTQKIERRKSFDQSHLRKLVNE